MSKFFPFRVDFFPEGRANRKSQKLSPLSKMVEATKCIDSAEQVLAVVKILVSCEGNIPWLNINKLDASQ